MKTIQVKLSDGLYRNLVKKAGNTNRVSLLASELIKDDADYSPNIEQAKFIGNVVSGKEIIGHNDTVVLGGTNYTYQLVNSGRVRKQCSYQVIDYVSGKIVLSQC